MSHSKYVVTITRQFGSMGRPIAKRMAEILQIEYYDRDLVDQAAEKLNLPVSVINYYYTVSAGQVNTNVRPFFCVYFFWYS